MGRYKTEAMEMSIARKAKYCKICSEYKPHDEFHVEANNCDGRTIYCKPCNNAYKYQGELRRRMRKGEKVNNCDDCGNLFMPRALNKVYCRRCQ